MAFILASYLDTHTKDENGNRVAKEIENQNDIVTNILKFVKTPNRIVWVANNPNNTQENDARAATLFESFEKTGGGRLSFKEKIILDKRNKKQSRAIILGADLVILCGGKCLCQNKFFRKIKLKKLLKSYNGLVIGISAGTMNLCKVVANFPEEPADLKEKRWLKGLGIVDQIIIPHFDGENIKYQIECEDFIDLINDYVLPMSAKKSFVGIPNGSYFLVDNSSGIKAFGPMYKIYNGEVEKIN